MNYYNAFLGFWFAGENGPATAVASAGLADLLNYTVLAPIYQGFDIPVADVAAAFMSGDFGTLVPFPVPGGMLPVNVALICQWTYMCIAPPVGPNIHANPEGYGVIAATFAATIPL
jgi:hypothetical protein